MKIDTLEQRARKLETKLYSVKELWMQEKARMIDSGAWDKRCKEQGLAKNYDFGDMLV